MADHAAPVEDEGQRLDRLGIVGAVARELQRRVAMRARLGVELVEGRLPLGVRLRVLGVAVEPLIPDRLDD